MHKSFANSRLNHLANPPSKHLIEKEMSVIILRVLNFCKKLRINIEERKFISLTCELVKPIEIKNR